EKKKRDAFSSSLSPHPDPLPEGEGKSTIRSLSWISDRAWICASASSPSALSALLVTPLSAPMPFFAGTKRLSSTAGATVIWGTASNWNPGVVEPVATDDVIFDYTNETGTKTTLVGLNA